MDIYIIRQVTVHDPEVDQLPSDLLGVLTSQDIEAIRTGPEYFGSIALEHSPDWLKKILKQCAEDSFHLEFISQNGDPLRPYFRFDWGGSPAISLPRPKPLRSDLPSFLRELYQVIGAFNENGFDYAGGLFSGHLLDPISETEIWVDPENKVDPTTAIPFLETLSGSQLCYLTGGGGAWLKAGKFHLVKNLEAEVASYFEALLDGKRI